MCSYGTQKRPCLGEGAKMVTGTEGRGPNARKNGPITEKVIGTAKGS